MNHKYHLKTGQKFQILSIPGMSEMVLTVLEITDQDTVICDQGIQLDLNMPMILRVLEDAPAPAAEEVPEATSSEDSSINSKDSSETSFEASHVPSDTSNEVLSKASPETLPEKKEKKPIQELPFQDQIRETAARLDAADEFSAGAPDDPSYFALTGEELSLLSISETAWDTLNGAVTGTDKKRVLDALTLIRPVLEKIASSQKKDARTKSLHSRLLALRACLYLKCQKMNIKLPDTRVPAFMLAMQDIHAAGIPRQVLAASSDHENLSSAQNFSRLMQKSEDTSLWKTGLRVCALFDMGWLLDMLSRDPSEQVVLYACVLVQRKNPGFTLASGKALKDSDNLRSLREEIQKLYPCMLQSSGSGTGDASGGKRQKGYIVRFYHSGCYGFIGATPNVNHGSYFHARQVEDVRLRAYLCRMDHDLDRPAPFIPVTYLICANTAVDNQACAGAIRLQDPDELPETEPPREATGYITAWFSNASGGYGWIDGGSDGNARFVGRSVADPRLYAFLQGPNGHLCDQADIRVRFLLVPAAAGRGKEAMQVEWINPQELRDRFDTMADIESRIPAQERSLYEKTKHRLGTAAADSFKPFDPGDVPPSVRILPYTPLPLYDDYLRTHPAKTEDHAEKAAAASEALSKQPADEKAGISDTQTAAPKGAPQEPSAERAPMQPAPQNVPKDTPEEKTPAKDAAHVPAPSEDKTGEPALKQPEEASLPDPVQGAADPKPTVQDLLPVPPDKTAMTPLALDFLEFMEATPYLTTSAQRDLLARVRPVHAIDWERPKDFEMVLKQLLCSTDPEIATESARILFDDYLGKMTPSGAAMCLALLDAVHVNARGTSPKIRFEPEQYLTLRISALDQLKLAEPRALDELYDLLEVQYKTAGDLPRQYSFRARQADILFQQERLDDALALYRDCLRILRDQSTPQVQGLQGFVYLRIALIMRKMGNLDKCKEFADRALNTPTISEETRNAASDLLSEASAAIQAKILSEISCLAGDAVDSAAPEA
ncbi:MAG: hypothetical protein IJ083_17855 [Clostridia bacterium]|nr:hypothetical protein [Clostridia bacterium]